MKTILMVALLSGQYCGTDVPYDFIIVDDVLAIYTAKGVTEECAFDGKHADCERSYDFDISEDADGNLVATRPGLKQPIVMPYCGIEKGHS